MLLSPVCVAIVRNDLLTGFPFTLGFASEETLWVWGT